MANSYFQFKQFIIQQDKAAMKVTTDACLFGAWVANRLTNQKVAAHVLDIGTGTGLLSLMLAQKNHLLSVDAIEIDSQTAAQAVENINTSPWKEQITVIEADARINKYQKNYDVIISNPPFYENELKSLHTKKNKAHHDEGLLLTELFKLIKGVSEPGGRFYVLLPYKRVAEISELLGANGLTATHTVFIRQSTNHDYFRIILEAKCATDNNPPPVIQEISIWNQHQQYTTEFINLLKDYYLYL